MFLCVRPFALAFPICPPVHSGKSSIQVNTPHPLRPISLSNIHPALAGTAFAIADEMKTEPSGTPLMPVWINEDELSPVWLQDRLQDPSITRASVEDISNATRKGERPRDGATLKVTITRGDHNEARAHKDGRGSLSPSTLILKQTLQTPNGIQMSKSLGLAREALFYKHLVPKLASNICIPVVYYAHGDWETGEKVILMEDLSSSSPTYVDSGILFGPGNPNNWKRDLSGMITQAYGDRSKPPSGAEVADITFRVIAKVHAKFWRDETLMGNPYLRGSHWIQGQGEAAWKASQGYIQGIYENGIDDKLERWDPLVKATLAHAMDGISWEAQLERLNAAHSNWTLVHGDFWPGNVLISTNVVSEENKNNKSSAVGLGEAGIRVLDWEMVGLGSGPQDLGQYILSNMSIEERQSCEERIVKDYWEELTSHGVDRDLFTWEECWREYCIGGVERFLWFLVYFCGQPLGSPLLKWGQFFHDQIAAFLKDHHLEPTDFVQPRP